MVAAVGGEGRLGRGLGSAFFGDALRQEYNDALVACARVGKVCAIPVLLAGGARASTRAGNLLCHSHVLRLLDTLPRHGYVPGGHQASVPRSVCIPVCFHTLFSLEI